jgi:hypothetical protein
LVDNPVDLVVGFFLIAMLFTPKQAAEAGQNTYNQQAMFFPRVIVRHILYTFPRSSRQV